MAYFVTGSTGFIGHHLLEALLRREGDVYVLVRERSQGKLTELLDKLERRAPGLPIDRVQPVIGDLRQPLLGIDVDQVQELRGKIDHFFHLAAVYDMTAPAQRNIAVNVGGTSHAVELARSLEAHCLHHVSSIAVAGTKKGLFTEDAFDEGQRLPSPYHKTKFESERIVREQPYVPWRVYRPAVVVGDSRTGEMDKIDGPYYFFKSVQMMRHLMPEWLPLIGLDLGRTNIVPVDWVAAAIDHIAHKRGLDGRAFHLTDPHSMRIDRVFNLLAEAAHAPRFAVSLDKRLVTAVPKGPISLSRLPLVSRRANWRCESSASPRRCFLTSTSFPSSTRARRAGRLPAPPIETPPPFENYVTRLWDYWERDMDPDIDRSRTLREAVEGRNVLITGASSGIGKATALKVAGAGGVPLLVARNVEKLEEVRAEIVAAGGTAYVYAGDISDMDDVDRLLERVLADHGACRHAGQQRGSLDQALGRAQLRALPRLRTHDAAQLLRRG